MRSIYIQLWLGPVAAPLIMRMHVRLGGVAMVCIYPHPASCFQHNIRQNEIKQLSLFNFSFKTESITLVEGHLWF